MAVTLIPDCATNAAPFDAAPYNGAVGAANCQTGDAGSSNFHLQLFANDGDDRTIDFSTPISACNLYVPAGSGAATYKNAWATVCTFTPTVSGVYPIRVKSSGIRLSNGTEIPDAGNGFNSYALRVQNTTTSSLYGLGALSMNTNTTGRDARFYLTDIRSDEWGKTLQVDVFDPGDGLSGDASVQILGPPAGAPNVVPSGGSTVPAVGLADSCRYNPTASPTRGPDVAAPAGAPAVNCIVTTRSGGVNRYENGWLSIEIHISPTYTCTTDCWWTVRTTSTGTGEPADRMVWSPILLDAPAP